MGDSMNVITEKKEGCIYQYVFEKDIRVLLSLMRQARIMAKQAHLEINNPWGCNPHYKLTIVSKL